MSSWGARAATQTIICVHGLTRNARDFDFLAQALNRRGARVLAVDVVGRGRSSWLKDPAQYMVATYALHLNSFIEQLRLETVDWIGTSLGGLVGMALVASGDPGSAAWS